MIVVDTSAILNAILADPVDDRLQERLQNDGDLHAPHLIDVEFLHALRRLERGRKISSSRAIAAREDFDSLSIVRYPHVGLADRAWELRHMVTAYDAMFIALASQLDVPLITCDARLGRATIAPVEVYGKRR